MATTTQPTIDISEEKGQLPEILRRLARVDWKPYALIAALQVITVFVFLANATSGASSGFDRFPLDDGWIHMIYARSFAEHAQLWYNPGIPESGMTSPLWAITLGSVWFVVGAFGIAIAATAKLLGIVFAILVGWLTMRIVWQLTRQRRLGVIAGALVAIEPSFAFAAVSGMEVMLFSLLALSSVWMFLQGRLRTTGLLFGLMILARPEGYVIFGIGLAAAVARRLWQRDRLELMNREDFRELVALVGPTLLLGGAWAAYNYTVNGTAWPNTYLAKSREMGVIPFDNIINVMGGYYHHLSFFAGVAFPITVLAILVGGIWILRRFSFAGVPLVFLPVGMTYAVASNQPFISEAWNFFTRRYLDAVIPFLIILMVIGFLRIWRKFIYWRETRTPIDQREAHIFNFGLNIVFVAAVILPFIALPGDWQRLSEDYSWNSKNVHDVDVGMAKWIDENLPVDARIGVGDAGAMRFFGNRFTYDLVGLNTSEAIGRPPLEFAEEKKIDFLFVFRSIYFDSWQFGEAIFTIEVDRNTILGGSELRAYAADYETEIQFVDPTNPLDEDLFKRDVAVIDIIDAGNGAAIPAYSESAHAYRLEGAGAVVERSFRTVELEIISDEATTFSIAEQFTVKSVPGELLIVAKRYDAALRGTLRVFANGLEVGEWVLADKDFFFGVDSFDIPGSFIDGDTTVLRFEVVPRPGLTTGNSFMWWIMVEGRVAQRTGIDTINFVDAETN
ncbi:MAG: hypothetical protein O6922_04030 [Chloroflexi bacterium]|nr:hypothetical protein [Chloroflexota bacterium]